MVWVRIDDDFPQHPKMLAAGPLARELQIAALCYSNRFLTDGRLSLPELHALTKYDGLFTEGTRTLPGVSEPISVEDIADRLIAVGAWEYRDGSFVIHDYEEYQPTKEERLSQRASWRDQKRRQRAGVSKSKMGLSVRDSGSGYLDNKEGEGPVHARTREVCASCGVGAGLHVADCPRIGAVA